MNYQYLVVVFVIVLKAKVKVVPDIVGNIKNNKMPSYILNADQYLFYDLEDWLEAVEAGETGDSFFLLFAFPIEPLFEKVKRRSALRGKLVKDQQGASQLDNFQVTEDERDIFIDFLQTGAAEIFRQISGFSKLINSAFRFNVNFGDPEFSSTITSVSPDGLTLYDNALDMTPNAYAGMKIVITTPGLMENQERTIVSNTDTSFVINSAFDDDVTDLEYIVAAQTEKYILIYSIFDVQKFDTNVILGIDALFEKCFIGTVLRDWYLTNRFMDDYNIELALLKDAISDLRMSYFQNMKPYRATPFFNDDVDTSTPTNP